MDLRGIGILGRLIVVPFEQFASTKIRGVQYSSMPLKQGHKTSQNHGGDQTGGNDFRCLWAQPLCNSVESDLPR